MKTTKVNVYLLAKDCKKYDEYQAQLSSKGYVDLKDGKVPGINTTDLAIRLTLASTPDKTGSTRVNHMVIIAAPETITSLAIYGTALNCIQNGIKLTIINSLTDRRFDVEPAKRGLAVSKLLWYKITNKIQRKPVHVILDAIKLPQEPEDTPIDFQMNDDKSNRRLWAMLKNRQIDSLIIDTTMPMEKDNTLFNLTKTLIEFQVPFTIRNYTIEYAYEPMLNDFVIGSYSRVAHVWDPEKAIVPEVNVSAFQMKAFLASEYDYNYKCTRIYDKDIQTTRLAMCKVVKNPEPVVLDYSEDSEIFNKYQAAYNINLDVFKSIKEAADAIRWMLENDIPMNSDYVPCDSCGVYIEAGHRCHACGVLEDELVDVVELSAGPVVTSRMIMPAPQNASSNKRKKTPEEMKAYLAHVAEVKASK